MGQTNPDVSESLLKSAEIPVSVPLRLIPENLLRKPLSRNANFSHIAAKSGKLAYKNLEARYYEAMARLKAAGLA